MLGKHHTSISIGTILIPCAPFVMDVPLVVIAILAGVLVGSLLPDTDASDSAIWYSGVTKIFGLAMVALMIPMVQLVFRARNFSYDAEHRGSLHTVCAVGISTIIFTVVGVIIVSLCSGYVFQSWLNIEGYFFLLLFMSGVFCGGVLHLAEDCCTKAGIFPFYPFSSRRIHGGIRTGDAADRRPECMQVALMVLTVGMPFGKVHYRPPLILPSVISLVALVIAWRVFFIIAQKELPHFR